MHLNGMNFFLIRLINRLFILYYLPIMMIIVLINFFKNFDENKLSWDGEIKIITI